MLTNFVAALPRFSSSQARSLEWLTVAHAEAEATLANLDAAARDRFAVKIGRAIARVGCGPDRINQRGQSVAALETLDFDDDVLYDLRHHPRGKGTEARTALFARVVDDYFADAYADEPVAPDDLIHVTCTGYVSPSGAQKLISRRGWGATRVTNAYQMGCYAALPALRIGAGFVATGSQRIDIAHTELCSLHLDPSDHSLEQLVVQSLFADGLIRYCMVPDQGTRGLCVLALHERVLPDSSGAMSWLAGDAGMQMTLSRDVPDRIASALRGFVVELLGKAGRDARHLRDSVVAVHPGGPKIIDRVREVLELSEAQVAASRGVLFDHGNMSSATLPHIWMRILDDRSIPSGTLIPSFAFGPGLTICGGLLEKR
ncbi:MAG TPA: 3-oxoacyl-[acyl-carrier-protein] synthase III C-terminal domain-containing protein [Kofleriaceae bacterium]|nr:3-oxoacyl-[acyl-carrier-protein] synthase III C-terminal domain-containing protein [Kofleriaceae bacterium]